MFTDITETPRFLGLVTITALIALTLSGCKIGTPYRTADQSGSPDDTVVIGVTYVAVGQDAKKAKTFWSHVWKVNDSLDDVPGFLGGSVRRKLFGNEGWTMTVWQDHQSLDQFVRTSVHRTAMREGGPALLKSRFARIEAKRSDLPISWKRAEQILEQHGWDYGHNPRRNNHNALAGQR